MQQHYADKTLLHLSCSNYSLFSNCNGWKWLACVRRVRFSIVDGCSERACSCGTRIRRRPGSDNPQRPSHESSSDSDGDRDSDGDSDGESDGKLDDESDDTRMVTWMATHGDYKDGSSRRCPDSTCSEASGSQQETFSPTFHLL